mmetsp:Transcript_9515/g.25874  ORF Transcript_9515/g.25874 Transcript_9515/m.25874 type:complete len:157 (+) Transcript_9515:807-1277(+)
MRLSRAYATNHDCRSTVADCRLQTADIVFTSGLAVCRSIVFSDDQQSTDRVDDCPYEFVQRNGSERGIQSVSQPRQYRSSINCWMMVACSRLLFAWEISLEVGCVDELALSEPGEVIEPCAALARKEGHFSGVRATPNIVYVMDGSTTSPSVVNAV